ncbi:SICAvar, type II (fragment) [Plasmodium knowlesi strain H]|uniref:SICAvar, type II n=1 Tax=Plasmodium knowlesi (strain H) TaxID=5851 RepID=A0A1A7VYI9_PLAKH
MKLQEVKYKLLHLLLLLNQPNRLHHPKQLLLPPPRSLQNLGIGLPLLLLWLLLQLYRRAPLRIPGPSVQEQLLDHVQQDSSHEYQLVKERKPPSVPARTKRSARDPAGGGRVNRRTIIKIHFELVDECQKGNTKLTQNDFLELLVREFMGSEFMEEEQVPKEEVLMEGVPMELVPIEEVPMERVPILGSVFMV